MIEQLGEKQELNKPILFVGKEIPNGIIAVIRSRAEFIRGQGEVFPLIETAREVLKEIKPVDHKAESPEVCERYSKGLVWLILKRADQISSSQGVEKGTALEQAIEECEDEQLEFVRLFTKPNWQEEYIYRAKEFIVGGEINQPDATEESMLQKSGEIKSRIKSKIGEISDFKSFFLFIWANEVANREKMAKTVHDDIIRKSINYGRMVGIVKQIISATEGTDETDKNKMWDRTAQQVEESFKSFTFVRGDKKNKEESRKELEALNSMVRKAVFWYKEDKNIGELKNYFVDRMTGVLYNYGLFMYSLAALSILKMSGIKEAIEEMGKYCLLEGNEHGWFYYDLSRLPETVSLGEFFAKVD